MKTRRIVATLVVLAVLLVCLPTQARAEEQSFTLTPRTMEQMKTITAVEDGVFTFTTVAELVELSNKAQSNPGKEYVCLYVAGSELHIDQDIMIPENMLVAVYYNNYTVYKTYIYVEEGVDVELRGYMEAYSFENKGTFRISSSGTLFTKNSMKTYEGVTYNSGAIVSEGGYAYGVMGAGNVHNEGDGVVQLSGYFNNQKDLIQTCQQAEERNDGHWLYFFESGNSFMPFDSMIVTVPSNCSVSFTKSQKIANSEMEIYGIVECSESVIFNGKIRIQPGGMFGVGAKFTLQGPLENYGVMAVVSNIEGLNGSLVMDNPQRYKDVDGANRGGIIVAAKAGEEYPAQALVGMNVNSFSVEWYQADGNSYWILTDYQDTLWVRSGTLGDNVKWILEGDTLTISGTGEIPYMGQGVAPWYDVKEEVKKLVIEEGITDFSDAAFSLNRMTEIKIADTVMRLPHNSFKLCHSLEVVTVPSSVREVGQWVFYESGVKTVYFEGDAPSFRESSFARYESWESSDLTVMYPAGNDTWTEEVRQDYGGNVTWVPYCDHDYVDTTIEADCIKEGGIGIICSKCGDIQGVLERIPPQGHDYGLGEDGNPDFWDTTCDVCGAERVVDKHRPTHSMYRMYNPNSGEHFYTGSMEERKMLEAAGWKYEGVGFTFPASTGLPVYRLFQPSTGEHLYTMDEAEKETLMAQGWNMEGVAFNSGNEDEVPQYRLYNPNVTVGAYHFTASLEERDALLAEGWQDQGIGFYTCLQ